MQTKRKLQFHKVLLIVSIWLILGLIIGIYDNLALRSSFSLGHVEWYSFGAGIGFSVLAAFLGAVMGVPFLVYYASEKFRDKPYWVGILVVFLAFISIIVLVTLCMAAVLSPQMSGKPLSHPETMEAFRDFVFNPVHLKNMLVWGIVVASTQLLLMVNDKFGPGLLWAFIRGKYHFPQQETRMFMFVDLRSSTVIAEKLGAETYYLLLRDFFADITNAILYNKGEIYQYVGDEVVITWRLEDGVENDHCLKCYFDMQEAILKKAALYQERFGLVPEFKAGLHYGKVTAGEIGIIKRDLTFSGDVLNTAARIQGQCNAHKVDLLTSDDVLKLLDLKTYKAVPIGAIPLRGKESEVALSTVVPV